MQKVRKWLVVDRDTDISALEVVQRCSINLRFTYLLTYRHPFTASFSGQPG